MNRKAFKLLLEGLSYYNSSLDRLENTLNCKFGDSFLTSIEDTIIYTTALNFFDDIEEDNSTFNTVCDILYYWIFTCDFGKDKDKLTDFYIENKGLETELKLSAITIDDLYNVINRYVNPTDFTKTISINC